VSHLPLVFSRFDLDVRAVRSHYHCSSFVGAEHLDAKL
jgi:hypothetical protein